ncbi:MAG: arsenate reductase [Gammaproteobacteria bacterium CG11_big_fil_rev_8_21_14_0_20_46_22]|nr:MAG: arsenate reductase [Gammaproteobacteria bacterium CG12_big_fil_rev_8_21_14_0_65_46_12]PIR10931.1 MAG: arsenate reductase [Gammaproteobacteria bacterium CG11_big_fil_rev_8_21_14_0_20_46_22]
MFILYGIKHCDTVKKALAFLQEHECECRFHDVRADGIDEALINTWLHFVSWETLVNTKSKTWQGLSTSEKQGLNEQRAVHLICQHPTLLKRPVLNTGKNVLVGFDSSLYFKAIDENR